MSTASHNGTTHNGRAEPPSDLGDLRREIAQTRTELGHTVEALAAKADVKARAREQVATVKARAREGVDTARDRARQRAGQALATTAEAGRRFRRDPVGQLRVTARGAGRSVRRHPTTWAVAAGALAALVVVLPRRWRR